VNPKASSFHASTFNLEGPYRAPEVVCDLAIDRWLAEAPRMGVVLLHFQKVRPVRENGRLSWTGAWCVDDSEMGYAVRYDPDRHMVYAAPTGPARKVDS
jgi:hypothetical protein